MGSQTDSANQIIAVPKSGGAIHGIGENFSPDLFTGTGNFTVPIAIPPGRNGFQPSISLTYSTGNTNGPFGMGWSLSVPGITRKTSRGIPNYDDATDTFVLSGFEDLVPVRIEKDFSIFRPRTEGLFARIIHHHDANNNHWEVRTKDGLVSLYGTPGKVSSDPGTVLDPAVVVDPNNAFHIFSWKLTVTTDTFGNRIEYEYIRDSATEEFHTWDQLYLSEIRYADYGAPASPQFLARMRLVYDGPTWRVGQPQGPPVTRSDSFSDYRAGFEIRTTKRCTQMDVFTVPGEELLVRSYHFLYQDQGGSLPLNGASLLTQIVVEGHDGTATELLPPLDFGYTEFRPDQQKFIALRGVDLPPQSLADPSTDLVDLFGQGLLDVLQMNGTVRYWRNRGNGTFDIPRPMQSAPAGVGLADPGVQLFDGNGDGKADLLVTTAKLSGYYPLTFRGSWDQRSFQRYNQAPSFNLKDPEIRMVDLDGDGVTDAIRSGTSLECYFNSPQEGWTSARLVSREQLKNFPNVNFSDPRVKWTDMTGDGLQDIVLVCDGMVQYWPNLGYGNWGDRITMVDDRTSSSNQPRFPYGYDPRRVLLGDVDGDGAADLVYVDDMKVTLWLNQAGNRWSRPIVIEGTPPVSDADSIRLADILGNGVAGILWTSNLTQPGRPHMFFLDLTGGTKPYLLSQLNNHLGSVTHVTYKSSTWFYLEDEKKPETRWVTPLPFPVQVVAKVETKDQFSGGKLTTEYTYHHGYWDGFEREFRGFGRVDHRDTEVFNSSLEVPSQYFSPPTLVRTWFHQGAIGDSFEGWSESDSIPVLPGQKRFIDEYYREPWPGGPATAQVLSRPAAMTDFISSMAPAVRRDAFRSMRGKVLRTELYALDGTPRETIPYTVTEHVSGVREESPPTDVSRTHIFFPFTLSQRTTQWERGREPLSTFTFSDRCTFAGQSLQSGDYDQYGLALSEISIGVSRGRTFAFPASSGNPYLATQTQTSYAQRDDGQHYIVDRISSTATYEIPNDGSLAIFDLVRQIQAGSAPRNTVRQTLSFYDGIAYQGLPFGRIDIYGALTRTESLVFTDAVLQRAYGSAVPPYLSPVGSPNWTSDYPQEFQNLLPGLAGYTYQAGGGGTSYLTGFYSIADRRKYDFQETSPLSARGLLTGRKDPLGNETVIASDNPYQLLPVKVTNAAVLSTEAAYDYRLLQPNLVTDANGNQTAYVFSPLGLLKQILVMGQPGLGFGDTPAAPGTRFTYMLMGVDSSGLPVPMPDLGQPVSVITVRRVHHASETDVPLPDRDQTIQTVEYSDGFGRALQTRTQGEDVIFDNLSPRNPLFGDAGLPPDQSLPGNDAIGQVDDASMPFVVVSGWQVYDNKGQVVEKYEPFFSQGWDYGEPGETQLGEKATLFYDPRGQTVRTVNPDGSEQRVVFGVPGTIGAVDVSNPEIFEPTPWEAYTYDADDNAGRTHPATSTSFQQSWDTPSSIVIDALGRTVKAVERNRENQTGGGWSSIIEYTTVSTYDIVGNLLTVTDPQGRTAFQYSYDLIKRNLRTQSIDAGVKRAVFDAANNIVEQRDSKNALILRSYDVLNRPIRMWARDRDGQQVTLRERIVYGDDSSATGFSKSHAASLNLLGKPYQHYEEAGLLTFTSYDFKGNLLDKTRNVVTEAALLAPSGPPQPRTVVPFVVDWNSADLSFLDTASSYETTVSYDALNRTKKLQFPVDVDGARKLLVPRYNRAGSLESVQLEGTTYVERIAYNAKGQRILIAYGNGLMTRYAYDKKTFRLSRLLTESYSRASTPPAYHPTQPARPLQDFGYEYDLMGNILALHDRTPGSGITNTNLGRDALDRNFVYDAIYRLTSATGREHQWQATPLPPPWDDTIFPIDASRATAYTETYQYDRVGNMSLWKHKQIDSMGHSSGANRTFALVSGNNQLSTLTTGSNAPITYRYVYDPSGNLTQENSERHFEWDQSDRMRVFRTQLDDTSPSVYAQYLYDSSGQRVMKLVCKQGGDYETTIYIDGVFELQRSSITGAAVMNNLLHVMDSQSRVAIVRVGNALPGDGAPDKKVKYHFGDHLGSSNLVADETGAWISREEYLPYGETSFGSFVTKRYRFSGNERDEESGLYYYESRYYSPYLGRWTSADPLGPVEGACLYAYARGSPLNRTDPTGLQSVVDTTGVSGGTPATDAELSTQNVAAPMANESGEPGFVDTVVPPWADAQCASCSLGVPDLQWNPKASKWDTLTAGDFMSMTPREQHDAIAGMSSETIASRMTVNYEPELPGPYGIEVSRPLSMEAVEHYENMQANLMMMSAFLMVRGSVGATGMSSESPEDIRGGPSEIGSEPTTSKPYQSESAEEFMPSKYWLDMSNAPNTGDANAAGIPRNGRWFWKEMMRFFPELFSKENAAFIKERVSPIVDEQWLLYHPGQEAFIGDFLEHHHVDQGAWAAGIPRRFHKIFSGPLHLVTY